MRCWKSISIHTDLALEEKSEFESEHVEVQGVILEEEYDQEREIRITKVKIETEKGARAMGKPVGTYITMEAPNMASQTRNITGKFQKNWQNISKNS